MSDSICPFSATLAKNDFGCRHAAQVIRRGGTEFACDSATAHARCRQLFECMKSAALPAFGVPDDLNQMPQSVPVKIQFGGLLGLQRLVDAGNQDAGRIEDIDVLLESALRRYRSLDAIPCDQLVPDITAYRLSRRRGRQDT